MVPKEYLLMPQESNPETQQETIDRLQKDSNFLRCLEIAGIDNCEAYSYAFEVMKEYFPEQYEELFGGE